MTLDETRSFYPTDELDQVIAAFLRDEAAGKARDWRRLAKQYPHLAQPLADFFADRERLERLVGPAGRPRASAPLPRRFGEYQLLEEIARGGMGVVYKACQLDLNRIVALKMILAGQLAAEEDVRRFYAEAEAAARLDHPNIVAIYEVGQVDDQHYFSMAYVDGPSLATLVRQSPLSVEQSARYIQVVAEAIHYAHGEGVLHRDLKPANVLLDEDDQPHITDFGLSKRTDSASDLTGTGQIVGTPSYMAPEQASGRRELGPTCDVYSLGAMLYELPTGRPPFRAESQYETLRQVVTCPVATPRSLNTRVPRDYETICLKCLAKEPRERYATAHELADELGRFLRGEPIQARPLGAAARCWRWTRRNPVVATLGAAAAALLVCACVFTGLRILDSSAQLAREEGRIEAEVQSNVYAARGVAATWLVRLLELARPVAEAAADRQLRASLALRQSPRDDRTDARSAVEELLRLPALGLVSLPPAPQRFESVFVLDELGNVVAHWPEPLEANFVTRDYFRGAVRRVGKPGLAAVHVSRVFEAQADHYFKFALSAPIVADEPPAAVAPAEAPPPRLLGVVVATIATGANFGLPEVNDRRHHAVLAGRLDGEPDPGRHAIVIHPAFGPHEPAVEVDLPDLPAPQTTAAHELALPDSEHAYPLALAGKTDHRDPVSGRHPQYAGRWLAGFAPVGNTDFVVIVEQPYDESPLDFWRRQRARWLLMAATLTAAVMLSLAAWPVLRHFRGTRPSPRAAITA